MGVFIPTRVKREYLISGTASEASISDGERWLNGLDEGLQWANVARNGTIIHGTNYNANASGAPYDDSTGLVIGPWSSNIEITAQVYTTNQQTAAGHNQEAELRLNSSLRANNCDGYELIWRCTTGGSQYMQLVRWNGPRDDFSSILREASSPPGLLTDYEIRTTLVNNVISAFQRPDSTSAWTSLFTPYDFSGDTTKFTTGLPGVGFWNRQTGSAANQDFGFKWVLFREL
jgi:hypothetical protein